MSDSPQPAAPDRDASRPVATTLDTDYTLSLDDVAERYAKAGHPRTIRSLQRYCAVGHLDCQKIATTIGDKYVVTPQSVARHVAQIEELSALDTVATERGLSRPVATPVAPEQGRAPAAESARQGTTEDIVSPLVARLEREVERATDEREFLREQIKTKDKQIDALLERDRETNILVRGLQQMLTPLLGPARHEPPEEGSRAEF